MWGNEFMTRDLMNEFYEPILKYYCAQTIASIRNKKIEGSRR